MATLVLFVGGLLPSYACPWLTNEMSQVLGRLEPLTLMYLFPPSPPSSVGLGDSDTLHMHR